MVLFVLNILLEYLIDCFFWGVGGGGGQLYYRYNVGICMPPLW